MLGLVQNYLLPICRPYFFPWSIRRRVDKNKILFEQEEWQNDLEQEALWIFSRKRNGSGEPACSSGKLFCSNWSRNVKRTERNTAAILPLTAATGRQVCFFLSRKRRDYSAIVAKETYKMLRALTKNTAVGKDEN